MRLRSNFYAWSNLIQAEIPDPHNCYVQCNTAKNFSHEYYKFLETSLSIAAAGCLLLLKTRTIPGRLNARNIPSADREDLNAPSY